MRTAVFVLSAAVALFCAAPALAGIHVLHQTGGQPSASHTPQPVPDAGRHGPTPVGRCVNDPVLLHRCTQAYNRCNSVRHRTNICTTDFNRCCMPPGFDSSVTHRRQHGW